MRHPPASNTLFGALCWSFLELQGRNDPQWIREYLSGLEEQKNQLLISSSFPCFVSADSLMPFYPMPMNPVSGDVGRKNNAGKQERLQEALKRKKLGRAAWISESTLREMSGGFSVSEVYEHLIRSMDAEEKGGTPAEHVMRQGMVFTRDEWKSIAPQNSRRYIPPFSTVRTRARNRLNRLNFCTGEGELFFTPETFLNQNSFNGYQMAFHFLLRSDMDESALRGAFRWLEDSGIGGDRSVGTGHYRIKMMTVSDSLFENASGKVFMTLARYLPHDEDGIVKPLSYELLSYRGSAESKRLGDRTWKERVLYFREGSVFEVEAGKARYGRLAKVLKISGQDVVRQYGFAFPVFGAFGG